MSKLLSFFKILFFFSICSCGNNNDTEENTLVPNPVTTPDILAGERVIDQFDGSKELLATINNEEKLPDVTKTTGRYRASLTNNTDNITLHYNEFQGRLDALLLTFPFEFIARNIGIGTIEDSQTAPASSGSSYIFSGVQVHVENLAEANSSHVVVGHRGGTGFTIEGKNTVDGNSSVNDIGEGTVPSGRADIRIVGSSDRQITVYWQTPSVNTTAGEDSWTLYNGTGSLPGNAPSYGESVYVGLITYAFYEDSLPFVGTADSIEIIQGS